MQMNWFLDAESHTRTWPRRFSDDTISPGALSRKAWANMLRDEGIQFTFVDYVTLIQEGVPGIHFFVLNKSHAATAVLRAVEHL